MATILEKILAQKEEEIRRRRERGLYFRPFWDRPFLSLKEMLLTPGFHIIAEVKRASPSKGLIAQRFHPVRIAREYQYGGASAISCLTDEPFFKGHLEYLAAIREAVDLPLLRKDFIIDEIQLEEARAFGADAVLLIVAALKPQRLLELIRAAKSLGLEALVEVHEDEELEIALTAGAEIIGINNRNLKTFEVNLETSLQLAQRVPKGVPVVAESGIQTREDIERLQEAGVRAALIGEVLMRSEDKVQTLEELLGQESSES